MTEPEGGMSMRALAATLGVSKSTVQRDIASRDEVLADGRRLVQLGKVLGVDGKVRPSRRVDTSERDAEIVKRRAGGESLREISASVGCSVGTVHRIINSCRGWGQ